VAPKFEPVIITRVPTGPEVGEMVVMWGVVTGEEDLIRSYSFSCESIVDKSSAVIFVK